MLGVPVILLLAAAAIQLLQPGVDRHQLVMGDSWRVCALDILTLSLPAYS